jgi:prefoldin subunit 5
MKVVEATIPEEEPEETISPTPPGPSHTKHDDEPSQVPTASHVAPLDIDQHVTDALRPLQEQIQSLKSQLEPMQTLKVEVDQLTARLADVDDLRRKVHTLTAELADLHAQVTVVSSLDAEMKTLKDTVSTFRATEKTGARNPLIPRFGSPAHKVGTSAAEPDPSCSGPQTGNVASTSNFIQPHPGIAPTTLGKRQRDSMTSDITGVIEAGQEEGLSQEELAKRVIRHTKKRAKLSPGLDEIISDQVGEALSADANDLPQTAALEEEEEEEEEFELAPAPRIPSFVVFRGSDEPPETYLDPPPPNTHLPEFFGPPSPPPGPSRPTTSTAQASENQNPFVFSFQATTSTPVNPMYAPTMPSFPYPEAPQSPSPVGSTGAVFPRHPGERQQAHHDLFQSFVIRRPGSAAASGSSLQDAPGAFINPAALTRPSRPEVSSNDMAEVGVKVAPDAVSEPAAPTMKKTMYGTELEGDTRFGDFGVEGVASGYWAGKGY